jgi:ElaB/YqjD/DUF883 family membrane-anchored ribosome-binding protein
VFVLSGELSNSICWLFLLQSQTITPLYSTAPPIWAQLFTVLLIGLLTAFAFQLLLTVLGIALGISILKIGSSEGDREDNRSSNSSAIGLLAGFGVCLTVNTVLFAACFLATKFGQVSDPIAGAIAGIVIWSAYFLLMLWLSSTAVSSLVGVVLDTLTGGFRRIVSAIASALAGNKAEPVTEEQMLNSIREEMQAALDTVNLRQMIEEQLQTIPPPVQAGSSAHLPKSISAATISAASSVAPSSLNLTTTELWQQITTYLQDASSKSLTPKRVDRKLQKILQASTANGLASNPALDLDALAQVLDQREDLSDKRKQRILDQFEQTWQQFLQESSIARKTDSEIADSESVTSAGPSSEERSPTTTKLLQSALDATVDQVLTHLPKLLQQSDSSLPKEVGLAPIVLSIALAKVQDSVKGNAAVDTVVNNLPSLNASSLNDTDFKQALEGLFASSVSLPNLNQSLMTQANQLREKAMQPIESIQQSAQERIDTVKRQTQQQIEMTRKAAATAAWWLFLTASTGAASAAFAGAWAAGFHPVEFFSSYVSSSAVILNGL